MKHARFDQYLPGPWVLCSLLVVICSSKPAMADPLKSERAAALRIEARNYEHGNTATRDPAKAVQLYCEASRLGDVEAQYNLGWIYANGRGVRRDDATAAYFFAMAAKQGDALSQRMLRQVGDPGSTVPECLFDSDGRDMLARAAPDRRKLMEMVLKLAPGYGV